MIGAIAKAVFGSSNDRYVKSLDKIVRQINALEPQLEAFSDEELQAQTEKFRQMLAGGQTPAVIDWKAKRAELERFLASTPFLLDLDARPAELAAGEKQKLELLKQLYLKPRLLILDEPTSVLTPQEADEVLGHVREFARAGLCTVLIITHKFREVMGYADTVTVLRRGRAVHETSVAYTGPELLASLGGAP